ncbi:TetR/AcrR family transcriptional regulator [Synechococcus sp. CS-1325]|uniref:TetR/AcrR family transcriptional regulator n=1 Tax=Synechococcus sp. CS-1325 TaxID=2847979 RepID=UPI000DB4B53F|nr:TetR/AcrR family transcriptional regulator [Synechococcus sp. CS-1325]MCT0199581.1 TetR/AcrR family transcriptional regulator [Synechococcus sp. CS-1325]PZV02770.1 MAG: TetR/AcrR family transcriptional regulator [Cyanobium sp.]
MSSLPSPVAVGGASAKRDVLLRTAGELFARQGYRAVGIDTVLAAAGVAKMTLYKHFRSKEELIAAVLEQRGEEIAAALSERIAAAPATPSNPGAPILAVFDWLADAVRSPEFHGCLFIKAASEYPDPQDLPRQAAEAFKVSCGTLLEALCRDLPATDPQALARQLQLLMEGVLVLAFLQRNSQAANDARLAAEMLLMAETQANTEAG